MIVHFYRVTMRHDRGRIVIHTTASSALAAARQVCEAEGAPPCAVEDVTQTTFIGEPIATELTPIGEQYVIPGTERNASPRVKQLNLFGG